jgi:hypothetical protein
MVKYVNSVYQSISQATKIVAHGHAVIWLELVLNAVCMCSQLAVWHAAVVGLLLLYVMIRLGV